MQISYWNYHSTQYRYRKYNLIHTLLQQGGAHFTTTQYRYCTYNSNQLLKILLNSIQISKTQLDTHIAAASGAHFTTTHYRYWVTDAYVIYVLYYVCFIRCLM